MENKDSSTKTMKLEKVKPFLESGDCWDEVTFEFDDGKKLYVSQNFLSLASPVFKSMFEHEFEEKRNKTVKLVGKVFDDVLELLQCLHPNIQKPVTFDNVLIVSAIAEEYQCDLIINRCKASMSKYLQSEIQRAIKTNSSTVAYECALTCLKILIEADKLNYDQQSSEAVEVITRFNFKYFTGSINDYATALSPCYAYAESKIIGCMSAVPIVPTRCVEDVAKDCKELYTRLPDKLKHILLSKRLYKCDKSGFI